MSQGKEGQLAPAVIGWRSIRREQVALPYPETPQLHWSTKPCLAPATNPPATDHRLKRRLLQDFRQRPQTIGVGGILSSTRFQ